jgi:hypothetical protein
MEGENGIQISPDYLENMKQTKVVNDNDGALKSSVNSLKCARQIFGELGNNPIISEEVK